MQPSAISQQWSLANAKPAITPASNPVAAAASKALAARGSSGGSSGGGIAAPVDPLSGWSPASADLSKNPIPGYYDQLLAYVAQQEKDRPGIFQAASDQIKQHHDVSNQQMYDAYLGSRQGTDASATALGVDPAVVSAARDLAMRKLQENSDQALASQQDWFTKAGLLSAQQAQGLGNQYAADKVAKSSEWDQLEQARVAQLNLANLQAIVTAAQTKAKSSGGGGGKKKSGGGSSGVKTGVTETMTSNNPEMDQMLADLSSSNPALAAAAERTLNLSGRGASVKAAQEAYDAQAQIANAKPKPLSHKPTGLIGSAIGNINQSLTKAKAQTQLPTVYSPLINFTKLFSGTGSNPSKKVVETTKGTARLS
jgi:hypothetical protein